MAISDHDPFKGLTQHFSGHTSHPLDPAGPVEEGGSRKCLHLWRQRQLLSLQPVKLRSALEGERRRQRLGRDHQGVDPGPLNPMAWVCGGPAPGCIPTGRLMPPDATRRHQLPTSHAVVVAPAAAAAAAAGGRFASQIGQISSRSTSGLLYLSTASSQSGSSSLICCFSEASSSGLISSRSAMKA